VAYTSTSGRAKAVGISHKNLGHSAGWHFYDNREQHSLFIYQGDWSRSITGILRILSQGGSLYLLQNGNKEDIAALMRHISEEEITHLFCLTSLYQQILEEGRHGELKHLSSVILAGEGCGPELVMLHRERLPNTQLHTEVGPAEASLWSTGPDYLIGPGGERITAGKPIADAQAFVVDSNMQLVPIGVAGDLYIGGPGVTRGYLRHSDLTAERFIPSPFSGSGERLYRTGNRAMRQRDGTLQCW
jgi:non-ribosomal peptide synthetase component F